MIRSKGKEMLDDNHQGHLVVLGILEDGEGDDSREEDEDEEGDDGGDGGEGDSREDGDGENYGEGKQPAPVYELGARVKKLFFIPGSGTTRRKWFEGTVINVEWSNKMKTNLYLVRYDDSDEECITEKEAKRILFHSR